MQYLGSTIHVQLLLQDVFTVRNERISSSTSDVVSSYC
jgi:hypothetical protein